MTKIYVSATFRDLEECRAAVKLALSRLRVEDLAMESYVAEDRRPVDKCLADVAECDFYVGIFAWRYGHIPPGYDKSITELEYRRAVADGKPCLIFLLDESAPWPRIHVDRGEDADRIEQLRSELSVRHVCGIFTDCDDLAAQVTAAVANRLTAGPDEPDQEIIGTALRNRYYTRLRQHYGALDLDALTPTDSADYLQIDLAAVFVEPTVWEDPPPTEPSQEWLRRMQADGHLGADDVPERIDAGELEQLRQSYRARPPRRLFDILGAPDRRTVVLLGDPGSGKSTVARYLALALTQDTPGDRLRNLTGHLPLLIDLRSYTTMAAEGRCDGFLDYLDRRAATDGLGIEHAALHRYLAAGGPAVAIFDGLDEVFDRHRREEVAGEIACFAADFPLARAVVTARIVGYSRRILTDSGFTHVTLHDLDEQQIAEFLGSWYRLAIPRRPEEAALRQDRLSEAIRHSHEIRELASNPLLLTILAIIGEQQVLPRERWLLYDHAATVLVGQWEVNRHLRDPHRGPDFLATADKLELLRRLAYRMQSAERGLPANHIAGEELSEVFEQYLVERYHQDGVTARVTALRMIDQFRERNFILSRYGPNVYGFVHRTFLEYFCANAIVVRFHPEEAASRDRLAEVFRRHWADPSWREVLRLVAGALPARHAGRMIELLLDEVNRPWPPDEFDPPPWNLALAVQCLAEVRDLSLVADQAAGVLRQIILLLEHSVSLDDRDTMSMIDEGILPAARMIGPDWPNREAYLAWYRRRGVRVIWSPVSTYAARLAAMLAGPADRVDDLFDRVLGGIDDSSAAYASVAGLTEYAELASAAPDGGPQHAAAVRTMTRMVRRACHDDHAGVRLVAVQALGKRFGRDPKIHDVLLERARADRYAGVRVAALQALAERFPDAPELDELLRDRAREDDHPGVRRTAVRHLGDRLGRAGTTGGPLLERLREDRDADVLRIAAEALLDRADTVAPARAALLRRAATDPHHPVRRAAVQLLADRLAADAEVDALLADRVRGETDGAVLRAAVRGRLRRPDSAEQTRELLCHRLRSDGDPALRQAALRTLLECYERDDALLALLTGPAARDQDADVRLLATEVLADLAGTDPTVRAALRERAAVDPDERIRLSAARSLIERVGLEADVCQVLARLARGDPAASVRLTAMTALTESLADDEELRPVLFDGARADADPRVRLAAVRLLARGGLPGREGYEILLDRARHDPDADVFEQAASAVIEVLGSTDPAHQLLADRLRDDSNARVRLVAVRMLVRQFGVDGPVRDILLGRVRHDPDPELVAEAATILAVQLGSDVSQCAALVARADDDDPKVRCAVAGRLGEWFGADRSVRELLAYQAANDKEVQVRREVLRVLGDRLASCPGIRELCVERLDDPDWSVRATALRIMGTRFGTDESTRTLLTALARGHSDPQFRRLAGQALSWLPGADADHLPSVGG